MDNPDTRDVATIHYEERPGKPTLAATGAFGGPTPDHLNVVAHLYVEHSMIPSISEVIVNEDGRGVNQGRNITRGEVRREIQAALVLTPQAAVGLGQWLIQHGNQCLKATSGQGAEE